MTVAGRVEQALEFLDLVIRLIFKLGAAASAVIWLRLLL